MHRAEGSVVHRDCLFVNDRQPHDGRTDTYVRYALSPIHCSAAHMQDVGALRCPRMWWQRGPMPSNILRTNQTEQMMDAGETSTARECVKKTTHYIFPKYIIHITTTTFASTFNNRKVLHFISRACSILFVRLFVERTHHAHTYTHRISHSLPSLCVLYFISIFCARFCFFAIRYLLNWIWKTRIQWVIEIERSGEPVCVWERGREWDR